MVDLNKYTQQAEDLVSVVVKEIKESNLTNLEIINVILKRYPKIRFSDSNIILNINGVSHSVYVLNQYDGISFVIDEDHLLEIAGIKIKILNNISENRILSKFRELLRYIKKLDHLRSTKKEIELKIKPIIESYIRNEYNLNIDLLDKKNTYRITFPSTIKYFRKKRLYGYFNVLKDKEPYIKYKIYINFKTDDFRCSLALEYGDNKLVLINKDKYYIGQGEDLTKIIRLEKLKSLM